MKRKSTKIADEILYCLSRAGMMANWDENLKPQLKASLIELVTDFDLGLSSEDESLWAARIDKIYSLKTDYIRRDRHLWAAQIHLISGDTALSIDAAADRVYLRYRDKQEPEGTDCYFWTWSSELEHTRQQVTHWQNHYLRTCTIDTEKRAVLLYRTDRVFDSLLVLSRLRYTFDVLKSPAFKWLIWAPSCNMFDIKHAVTRDFFEKEIALPNTASPWEGFAPDLHPNDSIIECLPEPEGGRSNLTMYFDKIINSIAAEEPQPSTEAFCLFVSFEFEKRVWKEQEEGISTVISKLLISHRSVVLLVNGMTSPLVRPENDAFETIKVAEERIIRNLEGKFGAALKVIHLHSFSTRQKIRWACAANYFICPAGSSMLFPAYLMKPGSVYGIDSFVDAQRWYMNPHGKTNVVPSTLIHAIPEDLALSPLNWSIGTDQGQSYSIDPDLFALCVSRHMEHVLPAIMDNL